MHWKCTNSIHLSVIVTIKQRLTTSKAIFLLLNRLATCERIECRTSALLIMGKIRPQDKRDLQRTWSGNINQDSRKRTKKWRKRGGKRKSGGGGLRHNMTKAERLSWRYFRICSRNCVSANKRGAALKRLDFWRLLPIEHENTSRKAARPEWLPGRSEVVQLFKAQPN